MGVDVSEIVAECLLWVANQLEDVAGEELKETVKPRVIEQLRRIKVAFLKKLSTPLVYPAWFVLTVGFVGPSLLAVAWLAGSTVPSWLVALVAAAPGIALWARWWRTRRNRKSPELDPSSYRQDTFPEFAGVVWRWAWKGGVADLGDGTDLLPRIIDLRPYCEKCKARFNFHFAPTYDFYRERERSNTFFRCEKCRHTTQAFPGSLDEVTTDVMRNIEHSIDTDRWKEAVEPLKTHPSGPSS